MSFLFLLNGVTLVEIIYEIFKVQSDFALEVWVSTSIQVSDGQMI